MSRSFLLIPASIAAAILAFLGFYLTGALASQVDPQALGLTANTAFALISIAAWGLPAGIAWLAAGSCLRDRPLSLAVLCAGSEVFILLIGLLQPSMRIQFPELRALAITLLWPAAFITLFSVAGALLGARLRQALMPRIQAPSSEAGA